MRLLIAILAGTLLGIATDRSAEDGVCAAALAHRDRAVTHYSSGNLSGAIAELRQAVEKCTGDANMRFMLANAYYRSGQLKLAAANYSEAIKMQESHFEARMSLGFTLFELGEVSQAAEHWSAAVRIEPDSPFARAALAAGMMAAGDVGQAEAQYERAVHLDARYADPDALGVDIRWKREIRDLLKKLKEQRD